MLNLLMENLHLMLSLHYMIQIYSVTDLFVYLQLNQDLHVIMIEVEVETEEVVVVMLLIIQDYSLEDFRVVKLINKQERLLVNMEKLPMLEF